MIRRLVNYYRKWRRSATLERELEEAFARRKAGRMKRSQAALEGHETRKRLRAS